MGGRLYFNGSDILGFCAFSLGSQTLGQWELLYPATEFGLIVNALSALSVGPTGRHWMLIDRPLVGGNVVYEALTGMNPPLIETMVLLFDGFVGNHIADAMQHGGYFETIRPERP